MTPATPEEWDRYRQQWRSLFAPATLDWLTRSKRVRDRTRPALLTWTPPLSMRLDRPEPKPAPNPDAHAEALLPAIRRLILPDVAALILAILMKLRGTR